MGTHTKLINSKTQNLERINITNLIKYAYMYLTKYCIYKVTRNVETNRLPVLQVEQRWECLLLSHLSHMFVYNGNDRTVAILPNLQITITHQLIIFFVDVGVAVV